jgi:hypothetical protein
VKRTIEPTSREDILREFPIEDPAAPGWYFRIREISAGAWVVEGRDAYGRSVRRHSFGNDPPINECVADALEITIANKRQNSN